MINGISSDTRKEWGRQNSNLSAAYDKVLNPIFDFKLYCSGVMKLKENIENPSKLSPVYRSIAVKRRTERNSKKRTKLDKRGSTSVAAYAQCCRAAWDSKSTKFCHSNDVERKLSKWPSLAFLPQTMTISGRIIGRLERLVGKGLVVFH